MSAQPTAAPKRKRWRRHISPITRRILAVNLLALAIPVAGILYMGEYRENLIDQELKSLRSQAEIFAVALGEGAVTPEGQDMLLDVTQQMVRSLRETTGTRARLFGADGHLVADSTALMSRSGVIQMEVLPPPPMESPILGTIFDIYDHIGHLISGRGHFVPYIETAQQDASDYDEVVRALRGAPTGAARALGDDAMVLSSAVPVKRYKQILGALMLSRETRDIDRALYDVRIRILKVFAIALAVTVFLSIYLAGTIARPVHILARAAERIRRGHHRQHRIPDFSKRKDEIGDLAESMRDMTEALWLRMDAIESFAADVSHEIKNPLTSLRSAVETAARVSDPEQQRKLMVIIQEDVERLDRLISDISDASRLDAELSRAEEEPVDIQPMLETLTDVYQGPAGERDVTLTFTPEGKGPFVVRGIDSRLAQVFRNLITNALSFSPPKGTVAITLKRQENNKDHKLIIQVIDEGPGLPEGAEDKIFKRFYTERPEGEKFGKHSGLGLSISQQIIENHRGTISAQNRTDQKGAVFSVSLPLS